MTTFSTKSAKTVSPCIYVILSSDTPPRNRGAIFWQKNTTTNCEGHGDDNVIVYFSVTKKLIKE